MIPQKNILAWQEYAPWTTSEQIEQDLILSRILVEIFSNQLLNKELAFRGGTALHKLFFKTPIRYSEDIDLVRTSVGPIGVIINTLREILDPWLGQPTYKRNAGRFTLYYKFDTETFPATRMRVKIEINTRESFTLFGIKRKTYVVNNPWFTGKADIATYALEELLATKLRALYQRRKGRDLFDLAAALRFHPRADIDKIIKCFRFYLSKENKNISYDVFIENIDEKLKHHIFINDIKPLLAVNPVSRKKISKKLYHSRPSILSDAKLIQERLLRRLK